MVHIKFCFQHFQELGKWHAISLAMKFMDPEKFNNARSKTKEIVYSEENVTLFSPTMDDSLQGALNSLNESNTNGELDGPTELLKNFKSNMYNIMRKLVLNENETWNVLGHGDFWINNLMFQKDATGKVQKVKFVDLQGIRYANPLIDVLQFLYSSTEKEIEAFR